MHLGKRDGTLAGCIGGRQEGSEIVAESRAPLKRLTTRRACQTGWRLPKCTRSVRVYDGSRGSTPSSSTGRLGSIVGQGEYRLIYP